MDLDRYLARIGYAGTVQPDHPTLFALHRAHVQAIPYENLGIHLGQSLTLDEAQIFTKIVELRRGGWCYEMNALFAWALRRIGFRVSLLASTVGRNRQGAVIEGDHLVLLVEADHLYLADVGFGNGLREPLPLIPGVYTHDFLSYELRTDGTRWFFTNHQYGGPGFDMTLTPQRLADFTEPCRHLQTALESGFVRTIVCHRWTSSGLISLRDAVLTEVQASGVERRTISDAATYRKVLAERFDLPLPEAATLWERAWERHQARLATE
jgi:N-hydroxyarylamine O-acetyltransferase